MSSEFESRFIKPIINASYPATLASLSLFQASRVSTFSVVSTNLHLALSFGGIMFLFTAVSLFFYTVYPTIHRLWTLGAGTFILGLLSLFLATLLGLFVG
jgi:hypothetical protein